MSYFLLNVISTGPGYLWMMKFKDGINVYGSFVCLPETKFNNLNTDVWRYSWLSQWRGNSRFATGNCFTEVRYVAKYSIMYRLNTCIGHFLLPGWKLNLRYGGEELLSSWRPGSTEQGKTLDSD